MIRAAGVADAERIAALHLESWRATYANELSPEFLRRQAPTAWAAKWSRDLAGGTSALVYEDAGAVAGFVACGLARGGASSETAAWEIYNVHVAPSRHGRGIGGQLFDAAAARGRAQGARELVLWVVRTNRLARTFYEAKGMHPDGGEQEHVVEDQVLHEVRYRLAL